MEIKSILGLLDQYHHINVILDNEKYDNPSLNIALYNMDQEQLDILCSALEVARSNILEKIHKNINDLSEKNILDND